MRGERSGAEPLPFCHLGHFNPKFQYIRRFVSLANCSVNYMTKEETEYDKRSVEDMDGTLKANGALYKITELPGHVLGMYSNFPRWWTKWSLGLPHAHFEDEVYFRARENSELREARSFVENDGVFRGVAERAFAEVSERTRASRDKDEPRYRRAAMNPSKWLQT